MKKYIGKKEINAVHMNRLEYNNLRGWKLPEDENGTDEGYLVEYIDGGKANHPDYKGYISWSPKDVFERAYRICESPLDRLHIEYDELMDKYNKLVLFLGRKDAKDIVGEEQFYLMDRQKVQMHDYLNTLHIRINLMKSSSNS